LFLFATKDGTIDYKNKNKLERRKGEKKDIRYKCCHFRNVLVFFIKFSFVRKENLLVEIEKERKKLML
jgi:hypothetical protein